MEKINQKGITLLSLVITIIVLLVIGSVTIYTGSNIIKKASLQTINTNMMLIQAKVKTISEQAKFNKDTSKYKGTKVSEVIDNEKIEELVTNKVIEETEKSYLLSQEDLNQMGLEKVKVEDGYVVNYETDEVIYVKGFEANGELHYKLSQMKNLSIK